MNLSKIWVIDPKTGEPSVSLTLVMTFAAVCFIAMIMEISGLTNNTSMSFELFGAACGLYWGRKFTSSKGSSLEKE